MGQEQVNAVLQSLMFRRQEADKARTQTEDERANQSKEQIERDRIQQAKDQISEQKRQFDLTHKLTQAAQHVALLKQEQDLIGNISEGQTVPGDSEISRRQVQNGDDIDEYVTHKLPLQDESGNNLQVELPSPETYARMQAKRNLAIKLPELSAAHDYKMGEIKATKDADFDKMKQQKLDDADKARLHEEAETGRNDATNKARIAVAQINHATGLADFDPEPWINGITNGDYTTDDVKKSLPKAQATAILNSAAQGKIRPLDSKQKDFLANIKGTADTLGKMDQFLQLLPDSSSKVGGIFTGLTSTLSPELTNLENEMAGRSTVIARQIAQDKGNIPVKLLDRAVSGYIPSRFDPKQNAIKKRDDFAKDLDSMIESHLGTLSPQQRILIKKKYGLDNLTTPYGSSGTGGNANDVFKQFGIPVGGK